MVVNNDSHDTDNDNYDHPADGDIGLPGGTVIFAGKNRRSHEQQQ
jgi:hypothetical protein